MSDFRTPPFGDFDAYGGLVAKQGDHLSQLAQWSSNECANSDGLGDGLLLAPLTAVVSDTAHFFNDKLSQCQRGMGVIEGKTTRTSADYRNVDQQHAQDLLNLYPGAYSGFPDISALPGGSNLGNFTDEDVKLQQPQDGGSDDKGLISTVILLKRDPDLLAAESLFKFCTGQSLVDVLIKPLFGDWGRLTYLQEAYDTLGDGCYTVAGTLRKGSWKLGSEWQGQTATAFDSYLFQWTMGIGGVGDAAKTAAKVLKDGHAAVLLLANAALGAISKLIKAGIKKLAEKALEMAAGDATIEAVGLGPEDPLADIGAGIYTAYKLYQIYEIVRDIINDITVISELFDKIGGAVNKIREDVCKVVDAINSPMPSIGSLIDDVEQRGFEFEKNSGWSPTLGASRIAMLPAA